MSYQVRLHEYENRLSLKNKLGRLLWAVVYMLLFRPFGTRYLNFWRVAVLRAFGAKIGRDCSIASSVRIWAPWNLEMADHTLLASRVHCYNPGKITIKSESVLSEGVYLCAASHDISSSKHSLVAKPIIIEDQVWVAVEAFVMMGVTLGQGSVVGARSVVVRSVEPWTVVGGNPAKHIKSRKILS